MQQIRKAIKESCVIGVVGVLIGLAANALSPRGISLTRDYFPQPARSPASPAPAQGSERSDHKARSVGDLDTGLERLKARLAQRGLPLGTHEQVAGLFRDPRYSQGLVVFVDARDNKHYQAGHIPGAYQFDHYRFQDHVQEVLPACLVAQQIVVYCNGGECEDSEFAAADLIELGISREKVMVYGGGLTEWNKQRMAIETGPRSSGNIVEPNGK